MKFNLWQWVGIALLILGAFLLWNKSRQRSALPPHIQPATQPAATQPGAG
jgi:drug/metabolite transporter (DMT)-like permease